MADITALVGVVNGVGDDLAHEIKAALEFVLILDNFRSADKDLPVHRLGASDQFGQAAIVDRHRAPAQKL